MTQCISQLDHVVLTDSPDSVKIAYNLVRNILRYSSISESAVPVLSKIGAHTRASVHSQNLFNYVYYTCIRNKNKSFVILHSL